MIIDFSEIENKFNFTPTEEGLELVFKQIHESIDKEKTMIQIHARANGYWQEARDLFIGSFQRKEFLRKEAEKFEALPWQNMLDKYNEEIETHEYLTEFIRRSKGAPRDFLNAYARSNEDEVSDYPNKTKANSSFLTTDQIALFSYLLRKTGVALNDSTNKNLGISMAYLTGNSQKQITNALAGKHFKEETCSPINKAEITRVIEILLVEAKKV